MGEDKTTMFRRKQVPKESDVKQRAISEFLHSLTMLTMALGRDEAARLAASAALAVAEDEPHASFPTKARSAEAATANQKTLVAR